MSCKLPILIALCVLLSPVDGQEQRPLRRVPVIYSTDLLHPYDDPDDHYDLATLFALPELDVRGIILDLGDRQQQRMGSAPVEQMLRIVGKRVPYAIGADRPLRSRDDKMLDLPQGFQGGIDLILSALRQAPEKVVIFTTGSLRDVAVAYNREPELLREKVQALYFNAGNGPGGLQDEWNVRLDPLAYQRVFESRLPLYWCPCFGTQGYQTHFAVDQSAVVGACSPSLQNYFTYCLTKSTKEPIAFLNSGPHPLPEGRRSMWCTAPLYHAAGRQIYQVAADDAADDFVALNPHQAKQAGIADRKVDVFRFEAVRVSVADTARAPTVKPADPIAGQLTAGFLGMDEDRVGTHRLLPDGLNDCHVQLRGLTQGVAIQNVIVTGPNDGRWEQIETGRWWRVVSQRDGEQLDIYFQFWAAGTHRATIVYDDKTTQAVTFEVPIPASAVLHTETDCEEPNVQIFRQVHPSFGTIMEKCLKNTLAELVP